MLNFSFCSFSRQPLAIRRFSKFLLRRDQRSAELVGWLGELSSSVNSYLSHIFSVKVKSDFDETWCEW